MRRSFALVAVLAVLVSVPVFAQQSGITLESLSARIETLVVGQQYVLQRVAALETTVAVQSQPVVVVATSTLIPSATPVPTSTPEPTETAIRVTPTATAAQGMITIDRRLSLRRGPGNSHSIVSYVEKGSQLEVLGRNLARTWIQVSYRGEVGWLPATYAEGVSSLPIVATPTPMPKPTRVDTPTPVPTATTGTLSDDEWEFMIELTNKDIQGMGRDPELYTSSQRVNMASHLMNKLREAADNCEMDLIELATIIDEQAHLLEETGIPEKLDAAARWDFVRHLTEFWDESVELPCERQIIGRRRWVVAYYEDEVEE